MVFRYLLKIFNPFIWCINFFNFDCHLESYRYCRDSYKPYNFDKDIKYF